LIIGRNDCHTTAAESYESQRFRECGVRSFADNNIELRGSKEAVRLRVPAEPSEQSVSRRGQTRSVRDRRSTYERDPGFGRETQYIDKPSLNNPMELRCDWRHDGEGSVLVPCIDEPGTPEGDWVRGAVDEPEVAAAA
jgi:hypothetical protein